MFESLVLGATLAASRPSDSPLDLRIDEQVESAAAVGAAFRFEPGSGRLASATRDASSGWRRASSSDEPVAGRRPFVLELDAESGTLTFRAAGDASARTLDVGNLLGRNGANLLRLEVANFDPRAIAAIERLELRVGEKGRALRNLGRQEMTRDLVTLWSPALASGFRLRGEIVTRGPAAASSRVWIDFGLGRGRRVEVEIDGPGDVRSEPPSLARVGERKVAVGYFDAVRPVVLEAVGQSFERWRSGSSESRSRELTVAAGAGVSSWAAVFVGDADASSAPAADIASPELVHNFSNTTLIDVPSGQPGLTAGPASPYPSTIVVGDPIGGAILDVNVQIKDMFHGFADDIDVLVVSPHGTGVILMSDACGSAAFGGSDRTFDDEASSPLSDSSDIPCGLGVIQPSNYSPADTFNAPAPAGPYQAALSAFDGENPNGTWSLYVMDDADGQSGSFDGGWQLSVDLGGYTLLLPGTGTTGLANQYPYVRTVSPLDHRNFGAILDLDVQLVDVSHQFPDDIDILLVGPSGEEVMLVSDACGIQEITEQSWTFDDEATSSLSDTDSSGCATGSFKPTDFATGESLPSPAPLEPYDLSLAVFDGDDPAGEWKVYARDDGAADVGYVRAFQLLFTTVGVFRDDFEGGTVCNWSVSVPAVICG